MVDAANEKRGFKMLLISLLVFNTFFIGNIWWLMQNSGFSAGCSKCSQMCAKNKMESGAKKLCPLTGKQLN